MSRDFSDSVPAPGITIDACPNTEAAGLRLASLATRAGIISELVLFPAETPAEDRARHLKRVIPAAQFLVVRCAEPGCVADKSIAAVTDIMGAPPIVVESEYQRPTMYGDSSWVDEAPLYPPIDQLFGDMEAMK